MGVSIPAHLTSGVQLAFARSASGGLSGWKTAPAPSTFWEGSGYVNPSFQTRLTNPEGAVERGSVFFYLEPAPAGGELPKASDTLLIGGLACEVLSVRPPNSLIDYWKLEVRTGPS